MKALSLATAVSVFALQAFAQEPVELPPLPEGAIEAKDVLLDLFEGNEDWAVEVEFIHDVSAGEEEAVIVNLAYSWQANEGSGTVVGDLARGNHCFINQPIWVDDPEEGVGFSVKDLATAANCGPVELPEKGWVFIIKHDLASCPDDCRLASQAVNKWTHNFMLSGHIGKYRGRVRVNGIEHTEIFSADLIFNQTTIAGLSYDNNELCLSIDGGNRECRAIGGQVDSSDVSFTLGAQPPGAGGSPMDGVIYRAEFIEYLPLEDVNLYVGTW